MLTIRKAFILWFTLQLLLTLASIRIIERFVFLFSSFRASYLIAVRKWKPVYRSVIIQWQSNS